MTDESGAPNPSTGAVVGALQAVRNAVQSVGLTLQRIESRQSPGLFRITPEGSSCPSGAGRPATHERLRVVSWVVTAVTAGTPVSLQVGETIVATVQFPLAPGAGVAIGTLVIPLPITIDRGLTVSTVAANANEIYDSFLILYTE